MQSAEVKERSTVVIEIVLYVKISEYLTNEVIGCSESSNVFFILLALVKRCSNDGLFRCQDLGELVNCSNNLSLEDVDPALGLG